MADATEVQTAIRRAGYEATIVSNRPDPDGATSEPHDPLKEATMMHHTSPVEVVKPTPRQPTPSPLTASGRS
jgi:hypothetical protein